MLISAITADQRALVVKEFQREAALMQALGHHPNCSTTKHLFALLTSIGSLGDSLFLRRNNDWFKIMSGD